MLERYSKDVAVLAKRRVAIPLAMAKLLGVVANGKVTLTLIPDVNDPYIELRRCRGRAGGEQE